MPGAGANGGRIFTNVNFGNTSSLDCNITIQNLTIDGNKASNPDVSGGSAAGISFGYADNCRVERCIVKNVTGLGAIYHYGTIANTNGQSSVNPGLVVESCIISSFTAPPSPGTIAAIFETGVQSLHGLIADSLFYNCASNSILIEDGASKAQVVCNRIISGGGITVISGTGDAVGIIVSDNLIISGSGYGILMGGSGSGKVPKSCTIKGNVIDGGCPDGGIAVATGGNSTDGMTGISITDNAVTGVTGDAVVLSSATQDCVVSNNAIVNNSGHGVTTGGSTQHNLIADNVLEGNTSGPYNPAGADNTFVNNKGLNPTGPQTAPGVPASTVAQINPFYVSVRVFVYGGTVSAIAIGGVVTGLTSGSFVLGVGETISLTYSVAPSWTWFGT